MINIKYIYLLLNIQSVTELFKNIVGNICIENLSNSIVTPYILRE